MFDYRGSNWQNDLVRATPSVCQATLAVIAIATSMMRMVAFTLPRCATRRKLGIQRYKARAGRQIATLFEQAASLERRMGKAAALAHIY
jgi:hypothetical protein